MNTKLNLQSVTLGLVALLLVMSCLSSSASPLHTGIRGQAVIFYPGFVTEVEPGVWIGVGSVTLPFATSFTIYSAHSGRLIGRFRTDAGGAFDVPLRPGMYEVVPDTRFGLLATQESFTVTVRARRFTDISIVYEPVSIIGISSATSP